MEVCGQLHTPTAYPWESFVAKYVIILLDGVFIHLLHIIIFKELRKEEYYGDRFS
jgi:hypothetical protein